MPLSTSADRSGPSTHRLPKRVALPAHPYAAGHQCSGRLRLWVVHGHESRRPECASASPRTRARAEVEVPLCDATPAREKSVPEKVNFLVSC